MIVANHGEALSPEELVIAYHERTKHHFNRFAESLGYLDWATQPSVDTQIRPLIDT